MGRPSSSAAGGYRRRLLHGILHRAAYSTRDVRDTVIVNIVPGTESALAADRQFPELSMAVFADALKPEKFSGVHFKSDLYIMESFHDFKMVNDKSIVQQAHDIQCIAKELEILKCSLPDPFVAGCIIAKLPSSWRSFATALKHKRTKISVEELIASLDVEEKARAKDTKGGEGHSVANTVQNQRNQGKGKGKFKPNKTTNFKKKRNKAELPCFTCGELGHFSKDCPERADYRGKRGGNGQSSKTVNTVTASKTGDAGYGNLPTVLLVTRDCSVLMGNGSAASILGTGTVDLKFTLEKIVQLKNMQHVPSMNKNLVSGSLLLRDGFKVVLESNKVVVSRHGLFIGKGYVSGGLFRLSLSDFSNKCVNHICGGVNDDASLWHDRLCHSIAYRFLVVKSDVPDMYVDSIMESRDAIFFENIFPMKDMHNSSRFSYEITPELNAPTEVFEPPREISPEEDNNEAPRKSKRQRVEKSFGTDFIVYLVDDTPTSISEAYASPDADNWKEAVQSELDSILSHGTWELTERLYGCKPVGCKWVFKKKLRPDGTIEKYKARLVAKGYTQKEGEDFFDTYSPIARMTTICVLLSMAVSYGLIIHQMDVKTAFLNGELEEEIYMEQADGFVVKGQESKVYIDVINKVKSFLSTKFDMKDLGEADVILNIKLIKDERYPAVLEGYSDANWISDDELYATSGYVFMLGGGAVSWRSCKQTILTRSTMEAELAALDTLFVKADWLRELLMDLLVVDKPIPAILMNCDNQTAIAKVNSDKENAKSSRHVRRRVTFVRKMRHSGVISVTYIQTEKNLADPFTKGLSRNVIDIASREMGLRPI
ncbi:hypothetical protein U9M48_001943 [Paspalum notatum var. saurae]|uniref:CCHC-type domain-containing protein n=1 Tax=Paspalum notatum var. saurae TaxID=547442 RepID=A0AAQ3PJ01_PASNO